VEVESNHEHDRKSQSGISSSDEDASLVQHRGGALTVLYGLVAFGQIQLRKIDGHMKLPSFLEKEWKKVA
jgi:hypothetical protein